MLASEIVVAKMEVVEKVVNMVFTNVVEVICFEINVVANIVELVIFEAIGKINLLCVFPLIEKTVARTTTMIIRNTITAIKYLSLTLCLGL